MNSVRVVEYKRFKDHRGWFSETYNYRHLESICLSDVFVQDNHSFSLCAGTVRGLHFQKPPYAQAKLVRCIAGRIFDVAVDIRRVSPTWGCWVGIELSPDTNLQLYIPVGFAHGFITLEPKTEVVYKVTNFYSADHDTGLFWKDPDIGIKWPLLEGMSIKISDKDKILPGLKELNSSFEYNGIPLLPLNFN
ncbi:dTDP-4-dehydrorhamnose 3,5-epimerase [Liberibacter crescens BT-1]|uniref:dTDP-4-dehydrorhamnose 3,5-epimerase n=1 Tax=Liberibacter crescens (strain BT-1) TaxID=1215343 RepID=L0EVM5_LIBCB|nr:dTDP-4-dehydrorhamnose 3,5-epimerase [Liberibacter crescens]AGA64992.1 dTDP-4-dehydrorhamnose 3,5-epimerase [Liberibacter crescens BT-1]AMC13007.1 dTDP-4-dehydrorhamnose 3,5-epimerase [Liberibacter crescens]